MSKMSSQRNTTKDHLIPKLDSSYNISMTDKNNEIITINNNNYDSILSESKRLILCMFVLGATSLFIESSCQIIWLLYAQSGEFNANISHKQTKWVLSIAMLWRGLSSLIYSSLSNKYGYDKGSILLLSLNVFSIFIQCITHNFVILSIAFCLSQCTVTIIVYAAIAWLLPHNNAIKYTTYVNIISIISVIFGTGFTTIHHRVSLRWVYWINFMIGCLMVIYGLLFVKLNSQKKLETKQINIKYQMKENDDVKYPIYIKKKQHRKFIKSGQKNTLSLFEYILIFLSSLANAISQTVPAVVAFYYLSYIYDYYPGKDIYLKVYGPLQLLVAACGGIIGVIVTRLLVRKHLFLKYILAFIAFGGYGLMTFFVFPYYGNIRMWFLFMFFSGLFSGCNLIVTQLILLVFQPPNIAGYIYGFLAVMEALCKASSLWFVGQYWNEYQNIMFYVLTFLTSIGCILSVLMGLIHVFVDKFYPSTSDKYVDGERGNDSTTLNSTVYSINQIAFCKQDDEFN
eukprot:461076_1